MFKIIIGGRNKRRIQVVRKKLFYVDTNIMIAGPIRMGSYPGVIQVVFQRKWHFSFSLKAELDREK